MPTIYPNGNNSPSLAPPLLSAKGLLHPMRSLRQTARLVTFWAARYRQRRALSRLSDHLLRDVGITRYDAKREAAKPFWRD